MRRSISFSLAILAGGCVAIDSLDDDTLGLNEGFVLGVNYPWRAYGHDFGSNAWGHDGVSASSESIRSDLTAVTATNTPVVRWFLLADGRAGLEFDVQGHPIALQPDFFDDFDAALDLAAEADVWLVPVLLDYLFFADAEFSGGVQMGGHADVATDADARAAFLDGVARPLFASYGAEPRVFAWDLINEPGWLVDGNGEGWLDGSVPLEDMQTFATELADVAREEAQQPITLGASGTDALRYWADLPLDLWQFHLYGEILPPRADDLGLPGPVVVGELSSADPGMLATLDAALSGGYLGAWPWSLGAEDDASELDLDDLAAWADRQADSLAR
jgi:hypothetical protein